MEIADKIMFATAIIWALFTAYAFFLLLPFIERKQREWQTKFKHSKVPFTLPSRPQRVVFLLLTMLMLAVSMTTALHHDLRTTIGISPGTAVCLMIILPMLYFVLGFLKQKSKNVHTPKG